MPSPLQMITIGVVALLAFCSPAQAEGKKYALVVGVKDYDPTQLNALHYAEDDAIALGEELEALGFDVVVMTARSKIPDRKPALASDILRQLDRRTADRDPSDTVIVAFSGHGAQLKADPVAPDGTKETYFCPERANLSDRASLLPMSAVVRKLGDCRAGKKLLLVDACRNEAAPKEVTAKTAEIELDPAGIVKRTPPRGTLILFSCSSEEKSFEFPALKHSAFSYHLLKYLRGEADRQRYPRQELSIMELASYVSRETRDFVDNRIGKDQKPELKTPTGLVDWSFGRIFVDFAGVKPGQTWGDNGPKMGFAWCPAGRFRMGSPVGEPGRNAVEGGVDGQPVEVTLSRGFWMGQSEVTIGQWLHLEDPSWRTGTFRSSDTIESSERKCRVELSPTDGAPRKFVTLTIEYDLPEGHFIQSEANRKGVVILRGAWTWGLGPDTVDLTFSTEDEPSGFWDSNTKARLWKYSGKSRWTCRVPATDSAYGILLSHGFGLQATGRSSGGDVFPRPLLVGRYDRRLDDQPVSLSWDQAVRWCRDLTEREGKSGSLPAGWEYGLPSEAQWEYSCRAGTTSTYSFGSDPARLGEFAWCDTLSPRLRPGFLAHGVKAKKPNPWQLYDMHGNVAEWCRDDYSMDLPGGRDPLVMSLPEVKASTSRSQRVVRSVSYSPVECRSAFRSSAGVSWALSGFRVLLQPSPNYQKHAPQENPNKPGPPA